MPRKASEDVTLEELQALRRSVLALLDEVDSMIAAREAAAGNDLFLSHSIHQAPHHEENS